MIANLIFPPLTWLVKTTLFCLILTVFKPKKKIRVLCYIGIAVTGVYYTIATVMIGWTCGPRRGFDRVSYLVGSNRPQCKDPNNSMQIYTMTQAVFNVISDFYILLIPLPVVAKLNMRRKRKIGVYCIFLAGSA